MGDIEVLYFEPDILIKIFLYLDLEDLVTVEDVCTDWNNFAVYQNIWQKKLKVKSSSSSWKFLLKNHDWLHLNYKESKSLYFHLASVIISPNFGKFIENDDLVIEYEHYAKKYQSTNSVFRFIKKLKTYRNRKSEENLYFERRQRDHSVIVQMLPKTTRVPGPGQSFVMSRLMMFGPSAFPVMVTRAGAAVMAGAYYGRGRVIVLAHENMLANTSLMIGAGLWVSGQDVIVDSGDNGHKEHLPSMTVDSRSKAWSRLEGDWVEVRVGPGKTVPTYQCNFLARSRLLEVNPSMYITQGHYDEDSDIVLEYVRRGGGLIIGGHSWWWADQTSSANQRSRDQGTDHSEDASVLLDHPGNKMLTEFGLAFSKETVQARDAAFPIKTGEVPSVKESFYYFAAMRARGINYRKSDESVYDELYSHSKRLEKLDRFEEIIRLNNIYLGRLNM